METPYRAVHFSKHDIIERHDMDQLQANYQWIYDNTPRGRFYKPDTTKQDTLVAVVSGRHLIRRDRKKDHAKVAVNLHKAFDPACRPAVTTGIVCDWRTKIFCVVNGPKGVNYPNASGFEIAVDMAQAHKKQAGKNHKNVRGSIRKNFWVHWQAAGYRTDDMHDF